MQAGFGWTLLSREALRRAEKQLRDAARVRVLPHPPELGYESSSRGRAPCVRLGNAGQ